ENNTLHRAMNIVVETPPGYRRGPIRVVGNVSDRSFGSPTAGALEFLRIDGLVVRNNQQPMQDWRDQPFVFACDSSLLDIRNNVVPGASQEVEVRARCPILGD
ncbi:MAG TPA: hypothetical protein VFH11_12785, partial [Gemmatimonadota bacterium]|nr:hypothetical protein [Gemmatimonadota bacterium]